MTYCWWGASGLHQGVCESAVTMTTGSLLWPGILPWLDSRGHHRREAPELCDMVALPEMPAPVRAPGSPGRNSARGCTFCPQPVSGAPPASVCRESLLACQGAQRPPWGPAVRQKNSQNSAELLRPWSWFTAVEGPVQVKGSDRAHSAPSKRAGGPQEVRPTGDTRSRLGARGMSWGRSRTTAGCPPSSPAPPEVELISPTPNHVVSSDYLTGPKVLGKQRPSNQAGHARGSQVAAQELGKSQAFLWNVRGQLRTTHSPMSLQPGPMARMHAPITTHVTWEGPSREKNTKNGLMASTAAGTLSGSEFSMCF